VIGKGRPEGLKVPCAGIFKRKGDPYDFIVDYEKNYVYSNLRAAGLIGSVRPGNVQKKNSPRRILMQDPGCLSRDDCSEDHFP
jgi:hypothetical protein